MKLELSEKKKRIIKKLLITWTILACLGFVYGTYILNNPADQTAIAYLWECEEMKEYGEITSIGRYVLQGNIRTLQKANYWYAVDTEKERIIVRVYLTKQLNGWIVDSAEIAEVVNLN